jgi:hypothetical protein
MELEGTLMIFCQESIIIQQAAKAIIGTGQLQSLKMVVLSFS